MKRLHAGLWLVVALCFAAAFGAGFAIYLRPVEAARNSAGTYSPTAGIPVVTHSTISSTVFNALISDIGSEITNSVDKGGRTTMTAQLPLYNGTVTSPSTGFASETGSGWYRAGAGDLRFAILGVDFMKWTAGTATQTIAGSASTVAASLLEASLSNANTLQLLLGKAASANSGGLLTYTPNATAANSTYCLDVYGKSSTLCVDGNGKVYIGGGDGTSKYFYKTTSITPSALSAGTVANYTFTVTGAAAGAACNVTAPIGAATTDTMQTMYCKVTADTCNIKFSNNGAGSVTPSAGTYVCQIWNP